MSIDMIMMLLIMLLPTLTGGLGSLFGGGGASTTPTVYINTGGGGGTGGNDTFNRDTQYTMEWDSTTGTWKYTPTGGAGAGYGWSRSNPLGGRDDNPFDLAIAGAAVGGVAGLALGGGPLLGWLTGPVGAGLGAVGGFLVDLWWM